MLLYKTWNVRGHDVTRVYREGQQHHSGNRRRSVNVLGSIPQVGGSHSPSYMGQFTDAVLIRGSQRSQAHGIAAKRRHMRTWRSRDDDGEMGMGIWVSPMTIPTYRCAVGSSFSGWRSEKGVLPCWESIGDRQGIPRLGRALEGAVAWDRLWFESKSLTWRFRVQCVELVLPLFRDWD